jgi:hypothetical protein
LGVDFDGETFTRDDSYKEFDEPLQFEETEKDDGIQYSSFEITLHPVKGGSLYQCEMIVI